MACLWAVIALNVNRDYTRSGLGTGYFGQRSRFRSPPPHVIYFSHIPQSMHKEALF